MLRVGPIEESDDVLLRRYGFEHNKLCYIFHTVDSFELFVGCKTNFVLLVMFSSMFPHICLISLLFSNY